jgi:hypothetical protein
LGFVAVGVENLQELVALARLLSNE